MNGMVTAQLLYLFYTLLKNELRK
uniref:Uncharacterized protein n=1 Tax=Rhizophora mucronata TaxID=61149 RepID=A0A2P2PC89_RHIMU